MRERNVSRRKIEISRNREALLRHVSERRGIEEWEKGKMRNKRECDDIPHTTTTHTQWWKSLF